MVPAIAFPRPVSFCVYSQVIPMQQKSSAYLKVIIFSGRGTFQCVGFFFCAVLTYFCRPDQLQCYFPCKKCSSSFSVARQNAMEVTRAHVPLIKIICRSIVFSSKCGRGDFSEELAFNLASFCSPRRGSGFFFIFFLFLFSSFSSAIILHYFAMERKNGRNLLIIPTHHCCRKQKLTSQEVSILQYILC